MRYTSISTSLQCTRTSLWPTRVSVLYAVSADRLAVPPEAGVVATSHLSYPGPHGCQCCTPYSISVLLAHTGVSAARRIIYVLLAHTGVGAVRRQCRQRLAWSPPHTSVLPAHTGVSAARRIIYVLLAHTGVSAARRIVYMSSWHTRVSVLHAV